ncbi:MAG: aldehyde dehydrogenase family protein [Candidatus Diapherotrites archaeon]|nr:aldehyde dehydrogenase family protein [Candidatus Diapherotrites archaeon]
MIKKVIGLLTFKNYINGKWVDSVSKKTLKDINPANQDIVCVVPASVKEDIDEAVKAAHEAFPKWKATPAPVRANILHRAAQLLEEKKDEVAKLMCREMGKVLQECLGDVQEGIDIGYYMAGEGRRLFGHTTPSELSNKTAFTMRVPIGVCALITPWNFPIAIPAWKTTAALVCGNTVVLKPSSDTPLCAAHFVELLHKACVPAGVVNMVTGTGETVGAELVQNKEVRAVSFTGSKTTGEWIAKSSGVKKIGLEMGGKNPIILMDDADLDLALEGVLWGAFGTTGQRCTAASRVIIHQKIFSRFEKMLVLAAKKLRLGSGLSSSTDVGPLINKQALEKSQHYVNIGLKDGARLLCGGKAGPKSGFFFQPTVFSNVSPKMRIAQEEIFGPIISLIKVKNLKEAIKVANSIEYGLSSSIYTNNISSAFKAINEIESGIVYVNASTIGAEVHLPFGGVKGTGNGVREAGIEGINEFSETKTVYIDYSGKLQRAQIDD